MILRWSDTRRDLCYSQYRDGQCSNPTSIAVTKSSCCCCTVILGQPLGWGSTCQACPLPGTREFEVLCPHGAGMTYNGDGKYTVALLENSSSSRGFAKGRYNENIIIKIFKNFLFSFRENLWKSIYMYSGFLKLLKKSFKNPEYV